MGLSKCGKGCVACCVCCAVVLAVMIPVSLLVIAPHMGQHALDESVMTISNATMWDIQFTQGNIFNDVVLTQKSLPFSSTMHETDLVMHVPASAVMFGWPSANLGYFTMPEETIKHGDNAFSFTKTFTPLDFDTMGSWATAAMFSQTIPGGFNPTLYIVGRPKLQALGIVHMNLKLGKNLTCEYHAPVTTTMTTTTTSSNPDQTQPLVSDMISARRLDGLGPVTLSCVEVGNLDSDLIDEILSNYTRERAATTTMTTTMTTTAATTAPSLV